MGPHDHPYGFECTYGVPIVKSNLITGEGRARYRGPDKFEKNRLKKLRKKTRQKKASRRRNRA